MSEGKKSQLDRFKEAARELETDDDEAKFNERLRKLAKQKPDAKKDDDEVIDYPKRMGYHTTHERKCDISSSLPARC